MSDRENPAGWKMGINDHEKNRNIIRTTFYLVAIPDETAMIAAMYDRHNLKVGAIGYQEAISEDDLKDHDMTAGEIVELMILEA